MAVSVCTIMFIKRGRSRGSSRGRVSSETWAGAIVKDDLVTSALEQRAGSRQLKFQPAIEKD